MINATDLAAHATSFNVDNLAPLLIGLVVIVVVIKLIKTIINRIISLAVAAVILGGGQQAGLFEGLGNFVSGL